MNPLHHHQIQLAIGNGGGGVCDQEEQRRRSIQVQHLLCASSDCEDSIMRLTPNNSELHLPDDTISKLR